MIERQAVFHDGELPLWNRYDSAGLPLLGQGQSCFGDPLHLIPMLANGASWAWDIKFLLAKWLFACGVGLCIWRLFHHLPGALLTTVSAAFMGFFVFRINHPAVFSFCYSPWILFCWIRCMDARSTRRVVLWLVALICANWTEMNSGTGKEAYVLLVTMNFTGLCLLLASEQSPEEKNRGCSEDLFSVASCLRCWPRPFGSLFTARSKRRIRATTWPRPSRYSPECLRDSSTRLFTARSSSSRASSTRPPTSSC